MSESMRRRIWMALRYCERAIRLGDPQALTVALAGLKYEISALLRQEEFEQPSTSFLHAFAVERFV